MLSYTRYIQFFVSQEKLPVIMLPYYVNVGYFVGCLVVKVKYNSYGLRYRLCSFRVRR